MKISLQKERFGLDILNGVTWPTQSKKQVAFFESDNAFRRDTWSDFCQQLGRNVGMMSTAATFKLSISHWLDV
jgi:hypothetical protein